ncbi:MAG TPA: glycosyltransferase [Roseiflexaceae bacterium]|nr:glycosyltransferase [Roseiflexaceae bacterium]
MGHGELKTQNSKLNTAPVRRIAYASPVNPAPSGISDYSEELLPFLGQYADITLYVEDGLRPSNARMAAALKVRPVGALPRDHARQPYDAIVYHMGNSPAHNGIWTALQKQPGVVVLHELVLHHFMLGYAANVLRDPQIYANEAARRYGTEGERVARLMLRGRLNEAAFTMPLSERVLEAADGLIAHSRYVLDRAAELWPGLPAAHVPMGVPLPPEIPRAEARRRLGLPEDALILASFGHINPYKRLDAVLRALLALREQHPHLRYLLVGSISPNYDVRAAIARAGLEDLVSVTGYVERAAFEDYLAAADICLNLRHPTAGETSASLLRLLGAGRPTLVTASGSFAELPPGVAAQVDLDASEGDLILAYCHLLATRPDIAAALGANARAFVAREHTLQAAAAGYIRFLAGRYGWGDTPILRPPLWSDEARDERLEAGAGQEPRTKSQEPSDEARGLRLGAGELKTQHSTLNTVGEALAGLGATEDDAPLLRAAARALTELN